VGVGTSPDGRLRPFPAWAQGLVVAGVEFEATEAPPDRVLNESNRIGSCSRRQKIMTVLMMFVVDEELDGVLCVGPNDSTIDVELKIVD